MAERTLFPCRIVTPEGVAFEGGARMLIVSGTGGEAGFLAQHAPLVAELRMGSTRVQMEDDSWSEWATGPGFAQVHDSTGNVLVDDAIAVEAIDVAAVTGEIERAKADLDRVGSDSDDPVFKADSKAAQRAIAWGEHLLATAERAAGAAH